MGISFNIDKSHLDTAEAMENPRIGDRFTEMYAFWMYIVQIEDGNITTLEANPPCELPKDGVIRNMTKKEFIARYSYNGTIKGGFWIRLVDRGNDVEGWAKAGKPFKESKSKMRYCPTCGHEL